MTKILTKRVFNGIYKNIGDFVNSNRLRIDAHPDQFCVLNSTNPKVLENTFNILKYHSGFRAKPFCSIMLGKCNLRVGESNAIVIFP